MRILIADVGGFDVNCKRDGSSLSASRLEENKAA